MRRRGSRRGREAPPSVRRLPTQPLEEAPPVGPAVVPSPPVVLDSIGGRGTTEGEACGLSPLTIPLRAATAEGNDVVPTPAEERSTAAPPPHDGGEEIKKKKNDETHVEAEEGYEALCGICFTQVDNAMNPRGILNSCQHFFCAYCIQEWGKQTNMCPSCKVRFTRIEIPAGPNREMKIIKVRRKNYSNWETNEESDEETGEYGEAVLSTLCCSLCEQSENPTQMIFCDRRDCTFIAHLECLHLTARPLTFLCASCQEEQAPSLAMEPTEETKTEEKKRSELVTAASSSPPPPSASPPPTRITGKKIPMTHLPPSVAQRLRTIHVAGEPVLALISPSPVSSSSRQGRRRSRSTSPPMLRGSASHSLPPHTSTRGEIAADDVSAMTGNEIKKRRGEAVEGSGPASGEAAHGGGGRARRHPPPPPSSTAALPITPFSSLPFTASVTHHPGREGPQRRGEEEVEEDPLYFLSPSPHTVEARGAFRCWKSDHPEVSFPPPSSWTAAGATSDAGRARSADFFPSDPSFTRVSPLTSMAVPKHVPADFERSLQRLSSSSSSFSPREKINTMVEADEADDSHTTPFFGKSRRSLTSSSSNIAEHARLPFSPSSSSSSVGSRSTAAPPNADTLEKPQRRAVLLERLTRERAADMISVVRQRRYIERHQKITVDRSGGGGGGTHAVASPHSAAEEEAAAWREAMNACRPQVEQQLRMDMAQLRAKKERKLRVEAQREALALEKLARLIASHHEAERRRREGQMSSTPVPTSSFSSNEMCVVVVNVEEDSL